MKNEELLLDIIEYTNQAMLYELCTYPSFGLVSPYSTGSHQDMNYLTFIDSTSVVNKYMFQFAKLGYSERPIDELYDEAVQIGLRCESEMFQKTKGVNTHKGLIFVLGTLVCSSMKALYDNKAFDSVFHYCHLLVQDKLKEFDRLDERKQLSNGERIYLKYKIEGVRKEAYLGFPTIQHALNVLDINDPSSFVKTLIYIMSMCDDTTIINRLGLTTLEEVKETMKIAYEKGFDTKELLKLEEAFIEKGISPGGSADLLSGTIFLSLIKNKFNMRRE